MRQFIIALIITVSPLTAFAGQIQTQRLIGTIIPEFGVHSKSPLAIAWKRELAIAKVEFDKLFAGDIKQKPKGITAFYNATFKLSDKTIILSIMGTIGCTEYSGASVAPSIQTCPAKIITLQHNKIIYIQNIARIAFAFPATSDDIAIDSASKTDYTLVSFNPSAHQITTKVYAAGKLSNWGNNTHHPITLSE